MVIHTPVPAAFHPCRNMPAHITPSPGAGERGSRRRADLYVTVAAGDGGQHARQVGNLSDFDTLSGQFERNADDGDMTNVSSA